MLLLDCDSQAASSKSSTATDESLKMAQWLWNVALRLRLHIHSWPTGCQPAWSPRDAAVHETLAYHLHGDRQLALAAFLALVTSRCGHRSLQSLLCCALISLFLTEIVNFIVCSHETCVCVSLQRC